MRLEIFLTLLAALPAIVTASPYGDGGRFGFKKCVDRGRRPGKISCINFDTIKTDNITFISEIPKGYTGLDFSSQFSAFNVTAAIDTLPPQNGGSAASLPNALIGSRYNPKDKKDNAPASFGVEEGTFDLFGFYMQPMGSPPPGATIYVKGYPADGEEEFMFNMIFSSDTSEPFFFETHKHAGPKKWDGLKKVDIWAGYGADEVDWEFFVDDLWIRWGNEEATVGGQHNDEPKCAQCHGLQALLTQ